jgi:hypothetical protein
MMTATVGALGLVPFLFATGPGSEIQRPLAIVVIGGLVSSTALTLLLLPAVYAFFEGKEKTDAIEMNVSPRQSRLHRLDPLELGYFFGIFVLPFAPRHCERTHTKAPNCSPDFETSSSRTVQGTRE